MNENKENHQVIEVEHTEVASELSEDKKTSEEPQVIIKKSGLAGLSILLSVSAIAISIYSYWKNSQQSEQITPDWNHEISTLQNHQSKLNQQINEQIKQHAQLKTQWAEIQSAVTSTETQTDYQPQLKNLQQQIQSQNTLIKQLQQQLKAGSTTPNHLKLPEDQITNDKRWAIDTLFSCRLLIKQGQTTSAIEQLQQVLNVANLSTTNHQLLTQLINSWQSYENIDINQWQQQLDLISQKITAMKLTTEPVSEKSQSAWYDRFISIKKISNDRQLSNQHTLMLLKTTLINHLQQAGWALTLSQQNNWSHHLTTAAELLPDSERALKQQLSTLAQTNIARGPTNTADIDAVIEELKGMR